MKYIGTFLILLFTMPTLADAEGEEARSFLMPPAIKHTISDAIKVVVGPNGQRHFDTQASNLLKMLGYNLSQEKIDEMNPNVNDISLDKAKLISLDVTPEKLDYQPALGNEVDKNRGDLVRGLQLKKVDLDKNMSVSFDAFVEDPSNLKNPPVLPGTTSRQPLQLDAQNQFDMSIAVDRGLINRVLQLSYLRGNFNNIAKPNGGFFSLKAVPTIDHIDPKSNASSKDLRIKVTVETEQDATKYLADKIVVSFSIKASLAIVGNSAVEIVLREVDLNSVNLDSKYINVPNIFDAHNKVRNGLKEYLRDNLTKPWQSTKTTLPNAELDMLPADLRNQVSLQDLSFEPSGHLIVHLNFVAPKAP